MIGTPMFSFQQLTTMSMGELSLALMLLRDCRFSATGFANRLQSFFNVPVTAEEARNLYTRLVEMGWIDVGEPDPARREVVDGARHLTLAAFTAFIRSVDEGHGALELSLIASLATHRIREAAEEAGFDPNVGEEDDDEDDAEGKGSPGGGRYDA